MPLLCCIDLIVTLLKNCAGYGTSLSGTIPSEIGLCQNISYFDLEYTQVSGSIPVEMANLRSLSDLWLSEIELLTGTFPYSLANQTMLTSPGATIRINGTMLTGEVPDVLCPVEGLVFDCPPMCGCDCPCGSSTWTWTWNATDDGALADASISASPEAPGNAGI